MFFFVVSLYGLNEELGWHSGGKGKTECVLYGNECKSVVRVLWECPVYKDSKDAFMPKLQNLLREG